ncbi:hypothetical protein GCM10023166_09900 [Paeniglutamicibacter cryotolerans]|uniref:Putative alpha/beta hydrolase n=1 Tax=Paeniglutamicibacter cryotolerans TaxID=670079 RepID=A0A839QP05_9MICC|nr:putative alpha/beta hydrolase [Paeniglutamicibacter cryotolerans]
MLTGFNARWYEWGLCDIEEMLEGAHLNRLGLPLHYVGHGFGGFVEYLRVASRRVHRILTVGSQRTYWHDYAPGSRRASWPRQHLMIPIVTATNGYFPVKRFRLEGLPRGVALDWARSRRDFMAVASSKERESMRAHQTVLTARILEVAPHQ